MRNLIYLTILGFLLGMSNQAVAAKIYTWKDAKGQVHFSSTPPQEVAAKPTGLTTGTSGSIDTSTQNGDADSRQLAKKKPLVVKQLGLTEQAKGDNESNRRTQDARQQQATRSPQTNTNSGAAQQNGDWRQEVINKCKANRGVDCDNPHYVDSKRPLTESERNEINNGRYERWIRNAIDESNRGCLRGGC